MGFLGPKFGRLTLQAGVAVSAVGWLLLVLDGARSVARSASSTWMPGLFMAGVGFGLIVAPMFDIILASVTDEETGSGSGVLNAGQQLANSIGVAVLGSVFFDAIGSGDYHRALSRVLIVELASMGGLLLLSPLLPRFAREPEADATPVVALEPEAV